MASLSGLALRGVAAALPAGREGFEARLADFGEEARRIAESTGVRTRRLAGEGLCASDLCEAAARSLLAELGWSPASIDALLFVSQTPDRFLPATAISLHRRLGLATGAAAFDVNLGCSGWVYGLWLAANLVASGSAARVLLLVGDTISRTVDRTDRTTALLFGDAGTATAVEAEPRGQPFHFVLGTDGAGENGLVVPGGAFREPDGGRRLRMDGGEVFSFTLREVPAAIQELLARGGISLAEVDRVVLHQANRFLLQHLGRKLKVPADRLVVTLEETGNTSGASIPLALATALAPDLRTGALRLLVCGFGVGWSWGAATFRAGPLAVPAVVEVREPAP